MKAFVYSEYGAPADVMRLAEEPKPTPIDDQVLVKVHAASVNAADWRMVRADPFLVRLFAGLLKPKKFRILGADIAGKVEAVGGKVTRFKPGDDVFGEVFASNFGGFAEYKCAKEDELAPKPANVSFEEAAATPLAALTALHGLRDSGRIKAGDEVLIQGASGGVGTFCVQLAKYFGAQVTAVCSGGKMDQARRLGADHVIDYAREDFVRSGKKYDLIAAVNGYRPIMEYRSALKPGGRYAMIGGGSAQLFEALLLGPLVSLFGGRKMLAVSSTPNLKDLLFLSDLLESGKLKPVIDRRFSLEEVPAAVEYVEKGHAAGKAVINIAG